MWKITIAVILVAGLSFVFVSSSKYSLERVLIVHFDSDQLKDPSTFTARNKRGDSYKTNVTATLLNQWSNNVSALIYYKKARSNIEHEVFQAKICDLVKIKWFTTLMLKYTDIPAVCPVLPNTYHLVNMELTPKLFPLQLPAGDNFVGIKYIKTSDSTEILKFEGTIRVE